MRLSKIEKENFFRTGANNLVTAGVGGHHYVSNLANDMVTALSYQWLPALVHKTPKIFLIFELCSDAGSNRFAMHVQPSVSDVIVHRVY